MRIGVVGNSSNRVIYLVKGGIIILKYGEKMAQMIEVLKDMEKHCEINNNHIPLILFLILEELSTISENLEAINNN